MPLNHQAGYKVLFKTTLNILVDRALMHHISFLSVRICFAVTPVRYEVGQFFFFFPVLFLYVLQKPRYLFKHKLRIGRDLQDRFFAQVIVTCKSIEHQSEYSALSACANKTVVRDYSSFSLTKGFFCFSFNKRSLEDALGKMCFFAYVISEKGSKLRGKKHAEHCLRHLNKTACEIWNVFDKVLFCVKYLTPFFHRTLH